MVSCLAQAGARMTAGTAKTSASFAPIRHALRAAHVLEDFSVDWPITAPVFFRPLLHGRESCWFSDRYDYGSHECLGSQPRKKQKVRG